MSTKYVLLYSNGSSEIVPVDEIEDYVPLRRQLVGKKRNSKKRKTNQSTEERPGRQKLSRYATKRVKIEKKEAATEVSTLTPAVPVSVPTAALSPVASRFVQDMLWALTTTYDISDEKQRALLASLDNRSEQPRAALARYIKEGGLDAMHRTLRNWACEAGNGDQNKDSAQKNAAKREPSPTPGNPLTIRKINGSRTDNLDLPDLVDLTGDADEDEDSDTCRRLRFGRNSKVTYSVNGSVDEFRVQVKESSRRTKRAKIPKQNPEMWKSSLKRSMG
ncbi:Avirulence protein [Phytophthora cinnamomi]|uniref:Avirulence protein n=1 Tax=Phytophthora cinnamomi TaxID=4785 RepID=UPI0035595211|nr:Avirulence protein [Phytophthora cinnamomi]